MKSRKPHPAPTALPDGEWLTLQVVAAHLRVTEEFLRREIAEGRLPGYRVGTRMIRLRRDDVEALVRPIATAEPPTGTRVPSDEEMDKLAPGWREDVRRVVDAAPPLTDRQRTELALLLRRTGPPSGLPAGTSPEPVAAPRAG